MADIEKIKVGSTSYNIRDANAYTKTESDALLDGFVDLSSNQTVAGVKTLSAHTIHRDSVIMLQRSDLVKGTPPASNRSGNIRFVDGQGTDAANTVGLIIFSAYPSGSYRAGMFCFKPVAGSTDSYGITIVVNANGDCTTSLPGTVNGDGSGLTNLNANNISSGTVPIENGGTGAATVADALAALGAVGKTPTPITNLDDCDLSGFYTISRPNANTNHGINSALNVLHIKYSGTNATQIAMGLTVDGIYYRRKSSGDWQAWQQISMLAV